eukprot:759105-Hanusia_phi.AAC.1
MMAKDGLSMADSAGLGNGYVSMIPLTESTCGPAGQQRQQVVKPRIKRRKNPEAHDPSEAFPVVLSAELLKKHFHLPLCVAAKKIGVCTTALKQFTRACLRGCRKIGIKKWPHRKIKMLERCRAINTRKEGGNSDQLQASTAGIPLDDKGRSAATIAALSSQMARDEIFMRNRNSVWESVVRNNEVCGDMDDRSLSSATNVSLSSYSFIFVSHCCVQDTFDDLPEYNYWESGEQTIFQWVVQFLTMSLGSQALLRPLNQAIRGGSLESLSSHRGSEDEDRASPASNHSGSGIPASLLTSNFASSWIQNLQNRVPKAEFAEDALTQESACGDRESSTKDGGDESIAWTAINELQSMQTLTQALLSEHAHMVNELLTAQESLLRERKHCRELQDNINELKKTVSQLQMQTRNVNDMSISGGLVA